MLYFLETKKKKRKEVIPDSGIAVGSGSRHVPNRRSIQDPEEGPRARRPAGGGGER